MNISQWRYIKNNREQFAFNYNGMAGTGSDVSTDPGASNIDPNSYLAPIAGGSKFVQILVTLALILLIIYLGKSIFKG